MKNNINIRSFPNKILKSGLITNTVSINSKKGASKCGTETSIQSRHKRSRDGQSVLRVLALDLVRNSARSRRSASRSPTTRVIAAETQHDQKEAFVD